MLFVDAAAAGQGDPREVADAFEWAYEKVQSAHPEAAGRLSPNQVEQLTDGGLDMIREMQLLNLDLQAQAVVPYERDSRDRLGAVIREGLA